MNWKDFFYFSRRERQGLIVLLTLLIGVFLGKFLFETKGPDPVEYPVEQTAEAILPNSSAISSAERETAMPEPVKPAVEQIKPRSNSNSARSGSQTAEESSIRTYYVREKQEDTKCRKLASYPKTEKLEPGAKLELNAADSLMLCKVPGIGAAFSRRIISYRNLLGGYHRPEQLQEVYGMYEELYEKIIPFFEINTDSLRKIPVNFTSLDKLRAHPYLNFYQAKAILEIRKRYGPLKSVNELILLEEFTEEDLEKLSPYLNFE